MYVAVRYGRSPHPAGRRCRLDAVAGLGLYLISTIVCHWGLLPDRRHHHLGRDPPLNGTCAHSAPQLRRSARSQDHTRQRQFAAAADNRRQSARLDLSTGQPHCQAYTNVWPTNGTNAAPKPGA